MGAVRLAHAGAILKQNSMKLHFLGGAREVTGANYLLETDSGNFLIDCGMHQGSRFAEDLDYKPFEFDPAQIKAVLVTHAHIDHTGRLPRLYAQGFRGIIYSTEPTRDLAELVLHDSAHILEEEAREGNYPPLYRQDDLQGLMELWRGITYGRPVPLGGKVQATFLNAGHILGSSSIIFEAEGKKILFSGDLGNKETGLLPPKDLPSQADYVLVESAYGGSKHESIEERRRLLEQAIEQVIKNHGVLLIPTLALERAQELLMELNELLTHKQVSPIPIYVDSPLIIGATKIFDRYQDYFGTQTREVESHTPGIFKFPGVTFTATREESKKINEAPAPKIIIAGSGMSTGGRILYHEARYLSDPKNILLIIAYQARGTRGRALAEGARQVMIQGAHVSVKAKVAIVHGYSGHADQAELLRYLSALKKPVQKVFVVQGEERPAEMLAEKIRGELGIPAELPTPGQVVIL